MNWTAAICPCGQFVANTTASFSQAFALCATQPGMSDPLPRGTFPMLDHHVPDTRMTEYVDSTGKHIFQVTPNDGRFGAAAAVRERVDRLSTCVTRVLGLAPGNAACEPVPAFDSFPEFAISLADLRGHLSDYQFVRRLVEAIVERTLADSSLPRREQEHQPPSLIHTPAQELVYSALPTKADVGDYYETVCENNAVVLVSAHQYKDASPRDCAKFVDQEVLSQLHLHGWSLKAGESIPIDGYPIVITPLHATHPTKPAHTKYHIQIFDWQDKTPGNRVVISKVLDLIQTLSPNPQIPVVINCAAGRGRTNIVGEALATRTRILDTWEHGGDIWKMVLNLAEDVYHIQQQRDLDIRSCVSPKGKELAIGTVMQMMQLTIAYAEALSSGTCPRK